MIDINDELIAIVKQLQDSTVKLTELVQILLGELVLMRKNQDDDLK